MTTLSKFFEIREANPRTGWLLSSTAFLLGVALPTSTFLLSTALVLITICLLLQRDTQGFKVLITHPLVWLPALMFLLLVLSLLHQSSSYGTIMVYQYKKLLFILPLALFFLQNSQLIPLFCSGFLLANAMVLVVSLLVGVLHIPIGHIDPADPTVFKNRITQNFFMALAALLWFALAYQAHGRQRLGYGLLAVLASYNTLFLVLGRTGYIAWGVGISQWLLFTLSRRQRLWGILFIVIAVGLLAIYPNRATDRVAKGIKEIQACVSNTDEKCYSSMGLRTAFAVESIRLIKSAPLLGHGVGGFYYPNPMIHGHDPHNEYLLVAVHTGMVGLLIFLIWIAYCYRAARQPPTAVRNVLLALLSSYLASCLFNSLILVSAEGHLFMILAAILIVYSSKMKKVAP